MCVFIVHLGYEFRKDAEVKELLLWILDCLDKTGECAMCCKFRRMELHMYYVYSIPYEGDGQKVVVH